MPCSAAQLCTLGTTELLERQRHSRDREMFCPVGVFLSAVDLSHVREKGSVHLRRRMCSYTPKTWVLSTTRGSKEHIWNHFQEHLEAVMSCSETQLFNYSISFATVKLSVAIQPPQHRSQHTSSGCSSSHGTLIMAQEHQLHQLCPDGVQHKETTMASLLLQQEGGNQKEKLLHTKRA